VEWLGEEEGEAQPGGRRRGCAAGHCCEVEASSALAAGRRGGGVGWRSGRPQPCCGQQRRAEQWPWQAEGGRQQVGAAAATGRGAAAATFIAARRLGFGRGR
jgi:hypothetical protein